MANAALPTRLIQYVDGEFIRTDFAPGADLVAAFEVRGFTFTGLNANTRNRAELQGVPKFSGVCGPTWDGDAIRYEDLEAYRHLSS